MNNKANLNYVIKQLQDKPQTTLLFKQILEFTNNTMQDVEVVFPPLKTKSYENFQSWMNENKDDPELIKIKKRFTEDNGDLRVAKVWNYFF